MALWQILTETPNSCGALLGRGTAYAFMRKLKKAIADFSKVTGSVYGLKFVAVSAHVQSYGHCFS